MYGTDGSSIRTHYVIPAEAARQGARLEPVRTSTRSCLSPDRVANAVDSRRGPPLYYPDEPPVEELCPRSGVRVSPNERFQGEAVLDGSPIGKVHSAGTGAKNPGHRALARLAVTDPPRFP